jgi:hypothetical protein
VRGNAELLIEGGAITVETEGDLGGTGIALSDDATLKMRGGLLRVGDEPNSGFPWGMILSGHARAEISGGQLVTTGLGPVDLFLGGNSQVTLVGSDFNFPRDEPLPESGTITGILQDGTPFSYCFIRRDPTATILLVPEPQGVALACCALLVVAWTAGLRQRPEAGRRRDARTAPQLPSWTPDRRPIRSGPTRVPCRTS